MPPPHPPSFWFSSSGLRSKKLSFVTSFLMMPMWWSGNGTCPENCSRLAGVPSPRDDTFQVKDGLTAGIPQIKIILCCGPFARSPQDNRLWRLTPHFPQASCPPQSCLPRSLGSLLSKPRKQYRPPSFYLEETQLKTDFYSKYLYYQNFANYFSILKFIFNILIDP